MITDEQRELIVLQANDLLSEIIPPIIEEAINKAWKEHDEAKGTACLVFKDNKPAVFITVGIDWDNEKDKHITLDNLRKLRATIDELIEQATPL
jgi:hypothetical protein